MKFVFLSGKFKSLKFLIKVPFWLIIILEYLMFIGLIIILISNIVPTINKEIDSIKCDFSIENTINDIECSEQKGGTKKIIENIEKFRDNLLGELIKLDPEDSLAIRDKIINFEDNIDLGEISSGLLSQLKNFGSYIGKIILALILSFIFIIDGKKLAKYLYKIKESNMGFFYSEYEILMDKVIKSFGLILKAQGTIALVNMIVTILGFYIIGLFYGGFPYILTMAIIVFIFSFIPILGMWISAIPLTLIAYINGGFEAGIFVLTMILFSTMFEAYFLNPNIVSSYLKIPVSLTFIILLISEHFFGFAGLLVGISLFYFLMGLIKDFDYIIGKNSKIKKSLQKEKKK